MLIEFSFKIYRFIINWLYIFLVKKKHSFEGVLLIIILFKLFILG